MPDSNLSSESITKINALAADPDFLKLSDSEQKELLGIAAKQTASASALQSLTPSPSPSPAGQTNMASEDKGFFTSGLFAPETFGKLNYIQTEKARRMPGTPSINDAITEFEKRSQIAQAAGNADEAYANQSRADVLRSDLQNASYATSPVALGTNLALSGLGAVKSIPRLVKGALTAVPSAGFAALGAKQVITPRQPGETAAEYALRVGSGTSQAVLGATGAVKGTQDFLKSDSWLKSRNRQVKIDPDVAYEQMGLATKKYVGEKIVEPLRAEVAKHAEPIAAAVDAAHPEGAIVRSSAINTLSETINKYFPTSTRAGFEFPAGLRAIINELGGVTEQGGFQVPMPNMTWAQGKSLRSALGAALSKIPAESRASRAPLSAAYADLSSQLRASAKEVGMEGSFDQYNRVHQAERILGELGIDDAVNAQSGLDALRALDKQKGAIKIRLEKLIPYGVNPEEVSAVMRAYRPSADIKAQRSFIDHWVSRHIAGELGAVIGAGFWPGYGGVLGLQAYRSMQAAKGAQIPPESLAVGASEAQKIDIPPPLEVQAPTAPIPSATAIIPNSGAGTSPAPPAPVGTALVETSPGRFEAVPANQAEALKYSPALQPAPMAENAPTAPLESVPGTPQPKPTGTAFGALMRQLYQIDTAIKVLKSPKFYDEAKHANLDTFIQKTTGLDPTDSKNFPAIVKSLEEVRKTIKAPNQTQVSAPAIPPSVPSTEEAAGSPPQTAPEPKVSAESVVPSTPSEVTTQGSIETPKVAPKAKPTPPKAGTRLTPTEADHIDWLKTQGITVEQFKELPPSRKAKLQFDWKRYKARQTKE